jgi:hypothetical protein
VSAATTGTDRLDRFLSCAELDDLSALAVPYEAQTPRERTQVSAALVTRDAQAVANLLMNPHMIAADERFDVIARALGGDTPYATLAAVVGLQDIDPSTLIEHQAAWVGERLVALCESADRFIAERASVTMVEFADLSHLDSLLPLIESDHEVVRHNVTVTIIALLGPSRATQALRHYVHSHDVNGETAEFVRSTLVELDRLGEDVATSDLGVPLLSYIPNLRDS